MNTTPCCGTCAFWLSTQNRDPAEYANQRGLCRFSPPTPMIIGMSAPGPTGLKGVPQTAPQPIVGAQFPPIQANGWCGCYRAAPDPVSLEGFLKQESKLCMSCGLEHPPGSTHCPRPEKLPTPKTDHDDAA